jgi:uncharacterized protein YqjF (DUF2071 family)
VKEQACALQSAADGEGAVVSVLFQNDFDYSVMDQLRHRPYPMRRTPWFMTQTWHDVLFLHWPVDAQMLRARVPGALELDLHEGQAYVAIAPFHMTNVAPRGLPAVPGLSSMAEVNVRTYVTAKGIPGIYFFSLDAASALAVGAARTMFHLPYHTARMQVDERQGWIHYHSRRSSPGSRPAELRGKYRSVGAAQQPETGSLEYFLTERYCLYAVEAQRVYRGEIHHLPWPLQDAEAEIWRNTMAAAAGIELPDQKPLLHFASLMEVLVWAPERLK